MKHLIRLTIVTFLFCSCVKQNFYERNTQLSQLKENLVQWLKNQQDSANTNPWIDTLRNAIQWNQATTQSFGPGRTITAIPLSSKITSEHCHKGTDTQSYLSIVQETSTGQIRFCNVVNMEKQSQSTAQTSLHYISNIYNANAEGYSGFFSVLTVFKRILFEVNYDDGRLTSFSRPMSNYIFPAHVSKDYSPQTVRNCTDWFLVTTYYWSDGTTSQTSEYVYTMCNGEMTRNPDGGDPGNGSATVDLVDFGPVINHVTNPCLLNMLSKVNATSMENFVTQLYTTTFEGYGHQLNLTLTEDPNLQYAGGTIPDPNNTSNVTISFNKTFFPNASQEIWANIYIHELIHNFIDQNNLGTNFVHNQFAEHEQMIMYWVSDAKQLLMQLYPNLSDLDLTGLALGGVQNVLKGNGYCSDVDWDAFLQQKYSITTEQVDSVIGAYENGTAGTNCP